MTQKKVIRFMTDYQFSIYQEEFNRLKEMGFSKWDCIKFARWKAFRSYSTQRWKDYVKNLGE